MNSTNHSSSASKAACLRSLPPDDGYVSVGYIFPVLSIALNLVTCPLIILLNALVIAVVKTKRRLQTNHNILLACLAATDLMLGIAVLPTYMAQEIYRLAGDSQSVFCKISNTTRVLSTCLVLASVFHLVLISIERLIAMKYSLRYHSIVTKFRLTVAVACSWFICVIFYLFLNFIVPDKKFILAHTIVSSSLFVIFYCHLSVYFVSRRHIIQIRSEQVSQEEKARLLKERKAWKTTSIIIGALFMCYIPDVLRIIAYVLRVLPRRIAIALWPLTFSIYFWTSLFNPIVYCWRSKVTREALMQMLP